jgi:hypothetical protein
MELKRIHENFHQLYSEDIERAEQFIFRKIQRDAFPEEYKALKKGNDLTNREFLQLNVFMDKEGILRINARIEMNATYYPQQYVPLLPRKNGSKDIASKAGTYVHQDEM